ncbi:hypothetical protein TNCV_4647381 [Trichonephila clavipes]|uniref:Uncharacterized protein n=1 Tax=Trichonephila clavipes TaxID=2585209 RepID=A0A8X6T3V0_TRICX|nr:hypothetical protein TNCV_4647381 [Trichonephila clavipes]
MTKNCSISRDIVRFEFDREGQTVNKKHTNEYVLRLRPVLTHASETWTLTKLEENRMASFREKYLEVYLEVNHSSNPPNQGNNTSHTTVQGSGLRAAARSPCTLWSSKHLL